MKLDDLRVALSPRRSWEAMDLGLMSLARWRSAVYIPWLAITLPLCGLICLALRHHPGWIPIVIWLTKPLLGRIPLHVLSTAVFGPAPKPAETLARAPQLLTRRVGLAFLRQRFSTRRGLIQPIDQLEQPKGSARKARVRVLSHGKTGGSASTALILFAHFEFCLALSATATLLLFGPASWGQAGSEFLEYGTSNATWEWIQAAAYITAVCVLEPAFVSVGFGLYLCRRTDLEGWDIELGFRSLASRLREQGMARSFGGAALLLACLVGFAPTTRAAALHPQDPAAVAQEVLESPEFDTTITSQQWVPPDMEFGPLEGLMDAMAPVLVALAWIAGAVLLILLISHLFSSRTKSGGSGGKKSTKVRPAEAFGLDLRQESLPADLAGDALALWNRGQLREALSLLYRGALVHLVDAEALDIQPSDTEHDCVERVHALDRGDKAEKARFFEQLTGAWLHSAWGARPPAQEAGSAWCESWSEHFGGAA